jgi:hypothetical protein
MSRRLVARLPPWLGWTRASARREQRMMRTPATAARHAAELMLGRTRGRRGVHSPLAREVAVVVVVVVVRVVLLGAIELRAI